MATRGIRGARHLTLAAASLAVGMMSVAPLARAQNATWLVSPGSGDFNTATNWNPAAVPTGTATFGFSNTAALSFSADTSIGGFTLNSGASSYNFTVGAGRTVSFTGAGITINGGSATFTNAFIINFDNAATAGTATINNNNTLAFHNSATAGGSTIVNNDFLQFFDGTSAGSSTLTNNHNTSFFATSTAGNAHITNTSVFAFYQTSTAGSALITNNSDLLFNDTSTAGNANITNNSIVAFFNSTTAAGATITNNVGGQTQFNDTSSAGSAAITNNGGSTLFQNSSTAGNANITNTGLGILDFFNNSTAGNATIINTNGTVGFSNSSTAGSASITNNVGATLQFNDTSTAGNATIVNNSGGLTQFFNSSTAGNATIANNGVGAVEFQNNADGGNARLINGPSGVFDFSTSTGPLGNGQINAGSIEGGGLFILGSNELIVGGNNLSTTVSGVISGNGTVSLDKIGSGTLTLTGTNTYTGRTLVNGGTLEVDGSIATSNMVLVGIAGTGGTLSGTGVVNRAGILSGGTLAPGSAANPTGTLTSMTNLTFQSAAFYLVQVGASASNTNVLGTASLANATVQVAAIGGVQGNKTYDILHSTNIGGSRFGSVQSLTPGFTETLSYSATDVFLNLTANLGGGGGLGGNQQSIATSINNAFNSGGTLPTGLVNLFNLSGAPLAHALTQVSGETATGSQQATFNAMGQFMGVMTDPFMGRGGGINGSNSAIGYSATSNPTNAFAMFTKAPPIAPTLEQRWSVWAAGFGGSQSTLGSLSTGSNNTTSAIAGTAVGADYLFSPNTIAGFALAGGGTNFSVANGGSGRSDLFQAGAYVRHNQGPAYVSAALAYGWQDITTNRTVTVAGLDQLRAEFNANAWSGRVEGGYRFVPASAFGTGITPYAAAQFVTFDLPAYAEQAIIGSNDFALGYNAKTVTDTRTELGVRTDQPFVMPGGLLIFRTRLAWAHDYNPDRSIAATFQALPGASLVVNGAAQAADSALATASLEMKWRNGWSAAGTFEGEFSDVTTSYAGKGVVRYQW